MKEAAPHIANPALQKTAEPFFQRSAEEGKDDSAFFSSIQTKLSVGAKDDPYEKEADAMADKVVNKSPTAEQAPATAGENTVQKKTDAPLNPPTPLQVQARFESDNSEEKLQKKEEENTEEQIQKRPILQRMCRECDEGDKVFRSGDPDVSGMSKRDAVIAMAKSMLGKIKAKQPGAGGQREGADKLWEIFKLAAPGVWQEEDIKTFGRPYPSWCGIFSVWAHKKAGIDLGNWQMGKGVSAFGTLKQTTSPQPGDIGYIDQPFQHHCIVTKVNGSTIESIDGNSGLYSEVIENTRPVTAYTGFFTSTVSQDSSTVNKKDAEASVQKQPDGSAGTAPSSVETTLASSKGGGSSLPSSTRSEMESSLGADFSNVKIHTDSNAVQMSKDLNAQAFTHGSDVYFNANKFNPGTSSGKHLLAHELTHTIQQGAAPSIQNKISKKQIQEKKVDTSPLIQRANEPEAPADPPEPPSPPAKAATPDDAAKIADPKNKTKIEKIKDTGKIEVNGSVFELTLRNFPLKEYADGKNLANVEMPKPGTRKTKQGKIWRDNMTEPIKKSVKDKVLDAGLENSPELELSLTNTSKEGREKTKFFGNFDALMAEMVVPFWTIAGAPQIHQIEHKIDWQILGNGKCDEFDNFLLLDMGTNMRLGTEVKEDIQNRIKKVLDFYKNELKIDNVTADTYAARRDYKVMIENFIKSKTKTKSVIEPEKLKPEAGEDNPIKRKNITIKEAKRPKGHFIFKTSLTGAGAVIPFDFKNKKGNLEFKGDIDEKNDKYALKTILLTKLIRDKKGVAIGGEETIKLDWVQEKENGKDKDNYFKLDQKGYAYSIKNKLKLKDLSQVVLDDDPTLDVHEGVSAKGKVISEISFLKGADIDFGIVNSAFFISTTISPGFLNENKKIPKPFSLDYGSITIEANSDDGLKVQGEIGFGIEKLGKGSVTIGIGGKGFHAKGKFIFDKSLFDGEIGFKYEEKKWTIEGKASMNGKKLKGIEKADISFKYSEADKKLTLDGNATLKLPGLSKVTINSTIGENGDFEVTTTVGLEKVPRILSGDVTVKIAKNQDTGGEWDLTIKSDNIVPDFSYGGLKVANVAFKYHKGAYDINISATYEKGRIKSKKLVVGVTNKPIGQDGKPGEGEAGSDLTFYGEANFEFKITDDIFGEIEGKLKPDGDIEIKGKIGVKNDKPLLPEKKIDNTIATVKENIPIASCVVATLSLHIGGELKLYATLNPLTLDKESNVTISNLSLKNFKNPEINSHISLSSHLVAGALVVLKVGLDASLLGIIHAGVGGEATVDFAVLDAEIQGLLDMGWSPEGGFKINEASISVDLMSKLKIDLKAYAEVYVDLWLTTITVWEHKWPAFHEEFGISLFEKGKKKWQLPIDSSGGKMKDDPDLAGKLDDVNKKASVAEVKKRTLNKVEGKGQTDEDKQAQVQKVTQDEVLANFRKPQRLIFNSSEDYLETRYGLYNYLVENQGKDEKIDLAFIDEEIRKAETEEYEAFTDYIMKETGFDDNAKATVIEDFIVNHPTLGDTEKVNLRSLIPVKAPASEKSSVKERGKQKPKQTPNSRPPKNGDTPIQAKAKPGGTVKANRNNKKVKQSTGQKQDSLEMNEFVDSEELLAPEMGQPVAEDKAMMQPASKKAPLKTRAATQPKKTPDGQLGQGKTPVQKKALNNLPSTQNNVDVNNSNTTIEHADNAMQNAATAEEQNSYANYYHNKSSYMRPYSRARKPLQQANEKAKSPFFSGPEKNEKIAKNPFFQAKLEVGGTNDPLEKEADKVADSVVAQKQPEAKKETKAPATEAKKEEAPKTAAPEEKKEEKTVQKKSHETEKEEENKTISKKDNAAGSTAPKANSIEASISKKNGTGKQLPASTLQEMQSAIGHDFSDVNIHTDEEAAALNQELGAHAFTQGKDIYFNEGKYDPEASSGKHLLAHELTHVVQQGKGKDDKVQPYRDKKSTHFGARDEGDLKEDSFNKKNKKEINSKPWIKEINIDFNMEKKDSSGKLIPAGTATAFYADNAEKLPPITVPIAGGSQDLGQTRSGNFTVHRIEGTGYNDVPLQDGEGPNNKYAKKDAGYLSTMSFAIFFDGGRALHGGDLDVSSHGCVHVEYLNPLAMQMNYHSVVGLTKVNVTFAAGLEKAINKKVDLDPDKTKKIGEYEALITAGRYADAVTKVKEFPEQERYTLLMGTRNYARSQMYVAAVKGTALDAVNDSLANLTRTAYIDVNYENFKRAGNWQKVAEFLNGLSKDDITTRLLRFDKSERNLIHEGALTNPAVGPDSQIAKMTTP